MKRSEQIAHLGKLSIADLQKEIKTLEKKLQEHTLAISFGKSKEVRTLRNLKRQVARTLTIANQKLRVTEEK